MIDPKDVQLVQLANEMIGRWRAAGGKIEEMSDGFKFCLDDDGPCVEVKTSTLRRLGRWVLALLAVIGRKLGVGV